VIVEVDAILRDRCVTTSRPKVQAHYQLTDAQFSVIAVAKPGKPSVVIDRIAYSPYGEATRTLRSDVNGDGAVNSDDYKAIYNLIGTKIGASGYIAEADLDRDGKITQADYDICIADWGQKSIGGVGEAALFSAGVRNDVGYCGYIYNLETGLYTVRFRTYSPTLGRWLTRDPDGTAPNRLPVSVVRRSSLGVLTQYADGPNLFQYCIGDPVSFTDYLGLQGSLCGPNTPQALLAALEAAGLTTGQIARLLALRGVSQEAIMQLLGISAATAAAALAAVEAEKQGLIQAIRDKVRSVAKRMAKEAACAYGRAGKDRECKGNNQPKSCNETGWDPSTGANCDKFFKRMEHFARCAEFRLIEAEFCDGTPEWKAGHTAAAMNFALGAANCAAKYLECKEAAKRTGGQCNPCDSGSGGAGSTSPK
jgi:RHS repeat-associated protein